MVDKIVIFEPNEFEIAVITYNRCEFIKEWLLYCYEEIKKRNIGLSIYDSSTDNNTEMYINDFVEKSNDNIIHYHRIDSSVTIGYKPMIPILNSKAKYIWVSGDSRYHDFNILDTKVFIYIKENIDYIILHAINNEENDGKIYTSQNELLWECFISMTCIGLSIYKTTLFDPIKYNEQFVKECDLKYRENYAFSWIGYFLESYSMKKNNAVFSIVPTLNIRPEKKVQSWFKRFYECWCENLCDLMDALSDTYCNTEKVIKDTWKYMRLDSPLYCYKARKNGDLTKDKFEKYLQNGMLQRVSKQLDRIERFALIDEEKIDECLVHEYKKEEKNFFNLCENKMNLIRKKANGKEIWIYGAGKGGKILKVCFDKYRIPVCGFIDINAENINEYMGLPVKSIDSIESNKQFIVISLFDYYPLLIEPLMRHGVKRKMMYYLIVEENEE